MVTPLPYAHVLWDFNGTILDDVSACMQAANKLLLSHGLPLIETPENYRDLFGFPVEDYYRRLGFDFEKVPYAALAAEWMPEYLKNAEHCSVYPEVPSLLSALHARGLHQWILSATEQNMLRHQVTELGILPFFDELLGLDDIHARSKTERGVRWRESHPDGRVLMLGDTDHDAETARVIGADCILLACGHQARAFLETCPCLFVADSASDALHRIGLC